MTTISKHSRQEVFAAVTEREIHPFEVDGTLSGFIDDRGGGQSFRTANTGRPKKGDLSYMVRKTAPLKK